jgi:hypothetical protein
LEYSKINECFDLAFKIGAFNEKETTVPVEKSYAIKLSCYYRIKT